MKRLRLVYKYILHFFSARNTRGFGVHSPYLFQFTRFVIYDKSVYYIFPEIENIRTALKKDNSLLEIKDFGTGKDRSRRVSDIAVHSVKSAKYGQLLYKIAHFCKSKNILELGTSLGMTTAYLASSSSKIRCVSLEGSDEISAIANRNFEKLHLKNIEVEVGNIDLTLPKVLHDFDTLDLVFIDANHKLPAIYDYFEQCLIKVHANSILIVDDIHWSADMEKAWKSIKNHPRVTSTIDLFQLGIVFFRADLNKRHYKMRY